MKLPVCPVHQTELKIKGPHYLICGDTIHKGTKSWECPHSRYWPGDLHDMFNIKRES